MKNRNPRGITKTAIYWLVVFSGWITFVLILLLGKCSNDSEAPVAAAQESRQQALDEALRQQRLALGLPDSAAGDPK